VPTRGEARSRATETLRSAGAPTPALDADVLRASPFSSPFSWDVSGKANVVADLV